MNDILPRMMKLQAELMKALGVSNGAHALSSFTDEQLQAAIGVSCEAAEILDAINTQTRKWKQKPFEVALANAREEAIDVLLYLLEFFILSGMDSAAVEEAFTNKVLVVMARMVKSSLTREQMNAYLLKYRHGHFYDTVLTTEGLDLAPILFRLVNTYPSVFDSPERFLEDPVAFTVACQAGK